MTFAGIAAGVVGCALCVSRFNTFGINTVDVVTKLRIPKGLKVETVSSSAYIFGNPSLSATCGVLISMSGDCQAELLLMSSRATFEIIFEISNFQILPFETSFF